MIVCRDALKAAKAGEQRDGIQIGNRNGSYVHAAIHRFLHSNGGVRG